MADQNESKTPKAPAGSVPQGVADELALLAAELRRMEQKASRGWKTSAIMFVILLAVIATYIGLLIYRPLKEKLTEETLVQIGFSEVDSVLSKYGAPPLGPTLGPWATQQLTEKAPEFMNSTVKPRIEEQIAKLPVYRQQLVDKIKAEGPAALDKAVAQLQAQVLPQLRETLIKTAMEQANTHLDALEEQMDAVVTQLIETNKLNIKDLNPENQDVLRRAMEDTLEQQLGPILDPMFEGISVSITSAQEGLSDLVAKLKAGTLTHEEKLEIGLVQLTYALFKAKASAPEEATKSLWEQIQDAVSQGVGGVVAPAAGAAPAGSSVEDIQNKIMSLEAALKQMAPDAENRAVVQAELDKAKKDLEAAKTQPAAAVPAVAPALLVPAMGPTVESLQTRIGEMEKALQAPGLTDDGRKAIQAEMDQAKKQLDALKSGAPVAATRTVISTPAVPVALPATAPAAATSALALAQAKVDSLTKALAQPGLTDEARKNIQTLLDQAKKDLDALKSGAPAPAVPPVAPAPAPKPAAAAPAMAPAPVAAPAAASSQTAMLQAKIDGLTTALQQPTMSDEIRKGIQAQLDQAKKDLAALKSGAPAPAAAPAAAPAPAPKPAAAAPAMAPAAGAAKPPAAAAGAPSASPSALALQTAQNRVKALTGALGQAGLTDEQRKNIQTQLDLANKELEALTAK